MKSMICKECNINLTSDGVVLCKSYRENNRENESESSKETFGETDSKQGRCVIECTTTIPFYLGQVVKVHSFTCSQVKFLTEFVVKPSCYHWPLIRNVAEIESKFVFCWDFEVKPTVGRRLWDILSEESINQVSDAELYMKTKWSHVFYMYISAQL